MAQFRAFSVYEDKPSQAELKKREPTFKPFVAKDIKKESTITVDNVKKISSENQNEKKPELPKEPIANRYVL